MSVSKHKYLQEKGFIFPRIQVVKDHCYHVTGRVA